MDSSLQNLGRISSSAKFIREFIRSPNVTGAIIPSSTALADTVVEWIDWENTNHLLEWGPGTGAFTQALLRQKPDHTRYVAIEVNSEMCEILRRRFPGIDVRHESVVNVVELCKRECIEEVDCIVSGLPWAFFEEKMQDEFLKAMMCVLRRGGQFTTFAYIHGMMLSSGQRFRRKLRRYFTRVTQSQVVWFNLPPAFVYRCRR